MFKFFQKNKKAEEEKKPKEPKKKNSYLPNGIEDYLYEYVYQFLESPYWTNPIQNFLDQFCYIMEYEGSYKQEDFLKIFEVRKKIKLNKNRKKEART